MSMTQTQQHNVPALRFPEFSGEWKEKRVGEIATFQRGFDLPNSERNKGNVPVVSSAGITGFHTESKVNPPGIVTGRYGSIGGLFKLDVPFWPLNTSLWVKDFHGNLVDFAFFHLSRIDFKKLSDKTGVPGVNRNDLHKIWSSIPPLPEQQKIASFLSSVDRKIEQLGKKKALLEQYKNGMMQKLFSQELRFKDAQGNDFPDWEEKRLGDVATFKKGKGISKADIVVDGQNKCIRYGELYTVYSEIIETVVSLTNTQIGSSVLSEENDVLMPTSDVTPNGLATASALNER